MTVGTVVGTVVVVAITIAIGVVADKKLSPRAKNLAAPAKPPSHAAGEAPATAIRAGAAQLAKLRAGQRCKTCRTVLFADGADDEVRFAEHGLLVLHFVCPACPGVRQRSLYVEPLSG
ncbi:MAG: hypothetical protein ABI591_22355 [Kofleriaceae bacterium]